MRKFVQTLAAIQIGAFLVFVILALFQLPTMAGPKPRKPSGSSNVSLNAADWTFYFGNGPLAHPTPNAGQLGWWFDVPVLTCASISECWTQPYIPPACCPQVDYIMVPFTASLLTKSYITITLAVVLTSGAPIFNFKMEASNNGTSPASVRALVFKQGDVGIDENGRWWSNPVHAVLSATTGQVTLTIPIQPDQWSNVAGKRGNYDAARLAGWQAALSNPRFVGLTFGGGSFFGHGVNVSNGTARFVMTDYSLH